MDLQNWKQLHGGIKQAINKTNALWKKENAYKEHIQNCKEKIEHIRKTSTMSEQEDDKTIHASRGVNVNNNNTKFKF